MTPRLKLLILDANVVIHLHELGLWQKVVEQCDIHLSRIVAETEVRYTKGDQAKDEYDEDIDISPDISAGRVQVFDVSVSEVGSFRSQFDPLYLGDLDDGEAESLTYMMIQRFDFNISSGDAIVYKVLGNLNLAEQGISLEEILQKIGLGRSVPWPYQKAFREKYTRDGQTDRVQGRGRKC